MARQSIDKVRTRNRLAVRREPYWGAPIDRGLFLGFRKLEQGGTWIARQRDDDGRQRYNSIGHADAMPYEDAVKAARVWAKQVDAGIDTSEVRTVADACREYVKDARRERGDAVADDAEGRFQRTVYGHAIGKRKLRALRSAHLKEWRADLDMAEASRNRTLSALKAALNFAVTERYVEADKAIEWKLVKPQDAEKNPAEYLTAEQRRALQAELSPELVAFTDAMYLTTLRPGAIAAAKVKDFNAKDATLFVRAYDKDHAERTVSLSRAAIKLFREQAKGKTPAAPLIAYADGSHWRRVNWCQQIRRARTKLEMPERTVAYSFRHSAITDLLTNGADPLTVCKQAGTSMVMLEKHYHHLLQRHGAQTMELLAL